MNLSVQPSLLFDSNSWEVLPEEYIFTDYHGGLYFILLISDWIA